MFREMRRKKQLLSEAESIAILKKLTSGVLAVTGDDDYPYAVPLSYVYHDHKLYFHSAVNGHKIDALKRNPKASFCVIDKDQIMPDEFTTYFRSVIVFGKARMLTDEREMREALEWLSDKYSPHALGRQEEIDKNIRHVCLIELDIEHISGKEAIELVRIRQQK